MRRIQSLLERAAHPATPQAERETAQEMAEKLMAKYRLDRAMLNFNKDKKQRREPSHREYDEIDLVNSSAANTARDWNEEFGIQSVIRYLRTSVYSHAGCKTTSTFSKFTAVGYEEDLFFADMLWATIFQDVVTKMFPGWDSTASMDENVFKLKNAGYSWPQVREMGLANGARDIRGPLTFANAGSKLRTAYNRYAKKIGYEAPKEQPRNPGLWRRSFVDSYAARLRQRLREMKKNSSEEAGEEGALALIQDEDLVVQKFYEMFPDLNPANFPEQEPLTEEELKKLRRRAPKVKTRQADMAAWNAGHTAASRVNLGQKTAGHKKEELA